MSPHAVNSFVNDLVAMAHAMERLPQVEAELAEWQERTSKRTDHIVALESNIIGYKAEIERLYAQIHELEVAKDAAETMFLEADDRTTRALEFVKAQFGAAGSLIQALELPRAEPPSAEQTVEAAVPQGVRYYDLPKDEPQPEPMVSEVKPIAADPTPAALANEAGPASCSVTALENVSSPQGQSEPDPTTAEPVILQSGAGLQTVDASTIGEMQSSPGPYSNKRYYDHPVYVSPDDWLAGGGTEADYHWRPSHDYGKDSPF